MKEMKKELKSIGQVVRQATRRIERLEKQIIKYEANQAKQAEQAKKKAGSAGKKKAVSPKQVPVGVKFPKPKPARKKKAKKVAGVKSEEKEETAGLTLDDIFEVNELY